MADSYTKRGPGRSAVNGFSPSRQAFIDAVAQNPVNRLSAKELRRLEKMKLTTSYAVWVAAQRIINEREQASEHPR